MLGEIALMTGPSGFEYIIVCCSNLAAENYWQKRLETTIKEVTGASGVVLCVHEDWNGGAGNGLGTLYAFQKACAKAKEMDGTDLAQKMRDGAAVALYHTAGKGTRMAPLPGAENNNKPGVKLPSLIDVGGEPSPITVLECVMRQTSSYASVRKARCSVFWGDQIFVPSCGIQESSMPADILAALRPMPTKAEWEAEELHQYGLIAVDTKGSATQLEKVTYDVAMQYLPSDVVSVGTSAPAASAKVPNAKSFSSRNTRPCAASTCSAWTHSSCSSSPKTKSFSLDTASVTTSATPAAPFCAFAFSTKYATSGACSCSNFAVSIGAPSPAQTRRAGQRSGDAPGTRGRSTANPLPPLPRVSGVPSLALFPART